MALVVLSVHVLAIEPGMSVLCPLMGMGRVEMRLGGDAKAIVVECDTVRGGALVADAGTEWTLQDG